MKTISVCSGRVCFATPSRGSSALYGRLRSYVHIRFLILVFLAEIVEVEIGGVAIYRPFGEFRRAKSYCHLYGAQGQRQAHFYDEFRGHRSDYVRQPTENSLAVLNHKILEANSQVQNVKLGGHQTCLSINRLWHELCDMLHRLVGTTAPGHHDCSIQE
ncbi:uncharacterized protein TNCV_2894911 [Trichonephila clavipes]|nr:uncharacterized protein TNCV_2894911 [Trichonephila clavipes]